MDNAISMGIYVHNGKAGAQRLPVLNESGFWQAWKMPDERFMVQPLNADKTPCGDMFPIEAQQFYTALTPLPSIPAFRESASPPVLNAGSPELLSFWLEQSRLGLGGRKGGALDAALFAALRREREYSLAGARNVPGGENLVPDEQLTVQRDPLPEYSGVGVPPRADASAPRAAAAKAFPGSASGDFHPEQAPAARQAAPLWPEPISHFATGEQPAGSGLSMPSLDEFVARESLPGPEEEDRNETLDERCRQLERDMRAEFAVLLRQLDEDALPATEESIARLIKRGAGFSSEQKFMFTEFGLALRRRHKPRLSLQCHLRALSLAPHDEHVLFNVARMEYELGNPDSAKKHLKDCLAAAPDFEAARNFLHFLNAGLPAL